MDINEWLQYGKDHGFCGEVFCYSHGMPEMSEEEEQFLEEDGEVCISLVRLY
jgi:hypothetical protein